MDIVATTRQMQDHKEHLERLKSVKACIDSSVPKSLGLKHLASRPKKQQLIDDRQATVAKENKKLMERMTNIMMTKRAQPEHVKPKSLSFRKLEVDRINFENKLLLTRLESVPAVLDRDKMERDFARHLKIGAHLRRRQIKPLLGDDSPTEKHKMNETLGGSFDNQSYMSQQGSIIASIGGNSIEGGGGYGESPITSMQEFRKHVISSKKMAQNNFVPKNRSTNNDNNMGMKTNKFEYTHNPI